MTYDMRHVYERHMTYDGHVDISLHMVLLAKPIKALNL